MVSRFIQMVQIHILMLVDLRPYNVKGNLAAESLCRANITCNKNGIPFDSRKTNDNFRYKTWNSSSNNKRLWS